jgi:ribonuclease HI
MTTREFLYFAKTTVPTTLSKSAIEMALHTFLADFENSSFTPENIVVFSDTKSALQSLDRGLSIDISNIQQITNQLLTFYGMEFTFLWIPGNTRIPDNERADKLS